MIQSVDRTSDVHLIIRIILAILQFILFKVLTLGIIEQAMMFVSV